MIRPPLCRCAASEHRPIWREPRKETFEGKSFHLTRCDRCGAAKFDSELMAVDRAIRDAAR